MLAWIEVERIRLRGPVLNRGDANIWEKMDWDVMSLGDDILVSVPPLVVGGIKVG